MSPVCGLCTAVAARSRGHEHLRARAPTLLLGKNIACPAAHDFILEVMLAGRTRHPMLKGFPFDAQAVYAIRSKRETINLPRSSHKKTGIGSETTVSPPCIRPNLVLTGPPALSIR